MRYFTKDHYEPIMTMLKIEEFEPIEDKAYTDEEIEELYRQEEEEFVRVGDYLYNTSPIDVQEDYLEESGADLKDILIWDFDEDGFEVNKRSPKDREELRAYLARGMEEELEDFESREDFDPGALRENFKEYYNDNLEAGFDFLPSYVTDNVDPRILALDLMPQSYINKLVEDLEPKMEEFEDKFTDLVNKSEADPENADDDLYEVFFLEDAMIYGLDKAEDGAIEVYMEGTNEDGDQVDRLLVLAGGKVLSKDEGLDLGINLEYELYNMEVYDKGSEYEVHFLLKEFTDLYEIVLGFEELEYDDLSM